MGRKEIVEQLVGSTEFHPGPGGRIDIDDIILFINKLKSQGCNYLETTWEHISYEESDFIPPIVIHLNGYNVREETDQEYTERINVEKQRLEASFAERQERIKKELERNERKERAEYERLKAKFENK